MKRGKQILTASVILAFMASLALGNGLNLNSLGTKALGMGGAFVGLADDFSAIYWNPAGVANIDQKQFGFYLTDHIPSGTYVMDVPTLIGPENYVDAETKTKHYFAGMAAYYHPLSDKIVVGLGVYTPSGLGAEWDGIDFAKISGDNPSIKWSSKIGLVTISPVIAYKISDKVSVGGTLNINYGMFDVAMHAGTQPLPEPPWQIDLGQYEETMKGWGLGATFGIFVKPSEMFSLGATFRTASKVEFSGDASISNLGLLGFNPTSDLDRDVTWPMWIAGGVAFKPIDSLTLTADLQYTQWSHTKKEEVQTRGDVDVGLGGYMQTRYKDTYWQIMMAQSGDDLRPMFWEDAVQIRFGAEYRINDSIALRGGYYSDPSPAPDRTMNVLLPNFDFNVIAVGIGYKLDGLQFDFGLEYLMGKKRTVDYLKTVTPQSGYETAMPGVYNMKLIVPNISVSYRF